ncbi:MAG: tRNA uridine-5-carboxymethylaminomethyl(34) synthesis GTPase MnmE [Eubacteriales bacterium]|nr:tRNA uridine-5-carboxymethylaminomethyl(34) synthesis GTPase MnmE [Eubacteriales bacterium]
MENLDKNIVAISTPIGNGGISIIRMSGKSVAEIADKVFFAHTKVSEFEPRKLYLGTFKYEDICDKCMCVYFKAPFSYTGEDLIEFQCHGGMTLTNKIFECLCKVGCVPAGKGEFSKLAFINGKISLDEAEGVIDMINAESESELRAGYNLIQGDLKSKVEVMQNSLTELLAKIEVTLDYPEEDLESETYLSIENSLKDIKSDVSKLLSTADFGRAIKEGTKILIYGRTNAGKSSLLNSLLQYNRAIVTDIQGTTRDTIEETFLYKGFKFVLIDTAGIRTSDNVVEKIGIERSRMMLKSADIVLFVIDGSKPLDDEDFDIVKSLSDKNTILCVNKSDIGTVADVGKLGFKNIINISCENGQNIDALKEKLYAFVTNKNVNNNSTIITNSRHILALKNTLKNLDTALDAIAQKIDLSLISIDIKNAWLSLGDITGNSDNEKIIDDIFSKFCVGK